MVDLVASAHPCCARDIPHFLYIVAPAHPCARDIPYFLYIVAPAHPCARDIPYFLYIKAHLTGCRRVLITIGVGFRYHDRID